MHSARALRGLHCACDQAHRGGRLSPGTSGGPEAGTRDWRAGVGWGAASPGLTDDSEVHGRAALGTQAVVRGAVVVSRMLCLQRREGLRALSGLHLPDDDFFTKELVQDWERASLGFAGKHHHMSLRNGGPRGAEGEDRTRHGD